MGAVGDRPGSISRQERAHPHLEKFDISDVIVATVGPTLGRRVVVQKSSKSANVRCTVMSARFTASDVPQRQSTSFAGRRSLDASDGRRQRKGDSPFVRISPATAKGKPPPSMSHA